MGRKERRRGSVTLVFLVWPAPSALSFLAGCFSADPLNWRTKVKMIILIGLWSDKKLHRPLTVNSMFLSWPVIEVGLLFTSPKSLQQCDSVVLLTFSVYSSLFRYKKKRQHFQNFTEVRISDFRLTSICFWTHFMSKFRIHQTGSSKHSVVSLCAIK